MVKTVVKPFIMRILRKSRVPKKSVFTRLFGVFCFFGERRRCPAPKARALPTALHPDNQVNSHLQACSQRRIDNFSASLRRIRRSTKCRHKCGDARKECNYLVFPVNDQKRGQITLALLKNNQNFVFNGEDYARISKQVYYSKTNLICQELFAIKKSPDFEFSGDLSYLVQSPSFMFIPPPLSLSPLCISIYGARTSAVLIIGID